MTDAPSRAPYEEAAAGILPISWVTPQAGSWNRRLEQKIAHILQHISASEQAALNAGSTEEGLLLAEQRHRFMNSLQMIASFVELRAHRAKTDECRVALRRVRELIATIAVLQRNLGEAGDGGRVLQVFRDQVELWRALGAAGGFEVNFQGEDLSLRADRVQLLLLIANELVTNAAEHAFTDRAGSISIRLRKTGQDQIELVVHDNGPGLPEGELPTGSGLELVRRLAGLLDGAFSIGSGAGTTATVRFTLPEQQPDSGAGLSDRSAAAGARNAGGRPGSTRKTPLPAQPG
jgi:two-component system, sensor histidine kinase PdtaS